MSHVPVLSKEITHLLNLKRGDIVIDATADGGGHTQILSESVGEKGIVVAIDQDEEMITNLKKKFENHIYRGQIKLACENFKNIDSVLRSLGINEADAVLFDLGMSSLQLENSGRGFSFLKAEEPLLMTYKSNPDSEDLTARDILNNWGDEKIAEIFKNFGEERFYKRIAGAAVAARKEKPFYKVGDLVEVIRKNVPEFYIHQRIHFATRVFQALRIAVNNELEALKEGLKNSFKILKPQGRLLVISFHSLEDRIVKEFLKNEKQAKKATVSASKPIRSSFDEIAKNPRSRSAKLRACVKL